MAAVLAQGRLESITVSTIFAADAKKFADKVKPYTNDNAKIAAELVESGKIPQGMDVDDPRLKKISKSGKNIEIEFDQGPPDTLAFLTHQPEMAVDRTLPDQLGCEIVPTAGIKASPPFYATTAPGVYAVGDCASWLKSVLMGMTMGSCAGVGIPRELPGNN